MNDASQAATAAMGPAIVPPEGADAAAGAAPARRPGRQSGRHSVDDLHPERAPGWEAEPLEDFFEHAPVGLHWVASDGTILRVNQTELDLLGYAREEYVGHHIAEFHVDPGLRFNRVWAMR